MLKGVIFDMDGVIVDSEPIHYRIFKKYSRELGFEIPDEEYNTFIGSNNRAIYTILKQKYNLKPETEEMIKTYEKRCNEYYDTAQDEKPIKNVDILIKQLHSEGIKLAIASSSPIESINAVTKLFDLKEYFDRLVSGSRLSSPKPAPDIFLMAAGQLGLEPSECAVVEDSQNGVTAAKAAGMKCIGFKNKNSGNQDISSADIIIDSFEDISVEEIKSLFD